MAHERGEARPIEPVEPPEDLDCSEFDANELLPRDTTAEARGWGPGWPANNDAKMAVVCAGGIALRVRRELAPLVERLVVETVATGYVLRHGECWGFANRPIRGAQRASNHSWGLAVDLNSLTNPMQAALKTDMPIAMVDLWRERSFRWGGDYRGRKDAMHFEFMGTPQDAARLIGASGPPSAALTTASTGAANASSASAALPRVRRKATGPEVEWLQARLNAHGAVLVVDGRFGARTEAAVKAFQQSKGLEVDGIVGPLTWEALR